MTRSTGSSGAEARSKHSATVPSQSVSYPSALHRDHFPVPDSSLSDSASAASLATTLAMYRAAFDAAADAMALIDRNGFYLMQNDSHRALLGYSDAELTGKTPAIHLGEAAFQKVVQELVTRGEYNGELSSRGKYADDPTLATAKTIELRARAVRDASGEIIAYVGVKRDVSLLRRTENALQARLNEIEALYRLTSIAASAESMDDIYRASLACVTETLGAERAAVLVYDADGVMRFKAWRDLSDGYRAAVTGHSPWARDVVDPQPVFVEDATRLDLGALNAVIAAEGIVGLAFFPLVYRGRLLGKFMTYYGRAHRFDATETQLAQTVAGTIAAAIGRRETELAHAASEARFRDLAESMPQIVWSADPVGVTDYVNRRWYDYTGLLEGSVDPEVLFNTIHPDDRARAAQRWQTAMEQGCEYQTEYRLLNRAGQYRWFLGRAVPIHDADGSIRRWYGTSTDIDEQRRSADRIRFQARLLDVVGQAVFAINIKSRVTYWNRIAEQLYGWRASETKGRDVRAIIATPAALTKIAGIMEYMRTGRVWTGELPLQRRGGDAFPAQVTCSPIYDDDERLVGMIGVAYDLSEQRRMEEELMKAQKLESVGVLAGGIAHDFNNILTGIIGNVALAKLYTQPGDKIDRCLDEAEKAFARARDLTQQLLTFSKGGAPIKQTASIAEVIRDSVGFALHGANVRCELELAADLHAAQFDPGQISQVINNLAINARQAMADGGVIRISAENRRLRSGELGGLAAGDYICVCVHDSGVGIPAQHLPKIFDPYFTTKQSGSGLGLATAYSIVKRHDGYIDVESQVGVGTRFCIYLPATPGGVRPAKPATRGIALGSGRLLFMDDETSICRVGSELLRAFGYEVDCARDGDNAVALYAAAHKAGRPYTAVILDLTVPGGMGGLECLKQLQAIDPAVRAIVSSGYSNDPVMSAYREHGFAGVVAKPYAPKDLSETVRRVIDEVGVAL